MFVHNTNTKYPIKIWLKSQEDIAEEYLKAYKNIFEVMNNQSDLVEIVEKVKTLAVIKG